MRTLVWIFLMGLLLNMTAKPIRAEGGGVILSPPFKNVSVDRLETEKSFEIEISNRNLDPVTLEITAADFGSLDESGGVAFLTADKNVGERKYSLASWISLEKNSVTVSGNSSQKVRVTVLNKESLSPGGHYGAVITTLKASENNSGGDVGVNQAMATLIYVLKVGGEKPNLIFKSLEWKNDLMFIPGSIKLRFENNGNVHLIPRGVVEIFQPGKNPVGRGIINDNSSIILPESFRQFKVTILPTIKWIWPGKYHLRIGFRYDGKTDYATFEKTFFYFGKEGVVIVLILILMISITTVWLRRKVTV